MPKVSTSDNRVRVHTDDYWKYYDRRPEQFQKFRNHDIGRDGHTYRVAAKWKGRWVTYAYSFPRGSNGVVVRGRRLYVHDQDMLEILQRLKQEGDLHNYAVIGKV